MILQEIYRVVARSSSLDRRRSRYTVYVSWVLVPVVLLFPMFNSYTGMLANTILVILAVTLIANLLIYATTWRWIQDTLPYIGVTVATGALLYFLHLGFAEGGSAMWVFVYPLLAMFMIGILWGFLGSVFVLCFGMYLMANGGELGGFEYSDEFIKRFALSFSLVTALALGYEYWRVATELRKEAIDDELSRARNALAEFANVCSWCNSIKSNEQQWQTLEEYISTKEDRGVSHSICPTCEEKQKAELS